MVKKYIFHDVKTYIESFGYRLLSNEYINNHTKLLIECSEKHKIEISFKRFKNQKQRCMICNKTYRYKYIDIKNYIEKEGYTLLSDSYINPQTKLKMKCPKGHVFEKTFNNFSFHNQRCPICHNINYRKEKHHKWKGGHTKLSEIIRQHGQYKQWQINSIQKYGRKCIISGKKADEIHHLKPFNYFIHEYFDCTVTEKINNIDNYKGKIINQFFKEHNKQSGVPLSKEIHKEFHRIYGKVKTTKEDFEQFYYDKTGNTFMEDNYG